MKKNDLNNQAMDIWCEKVELGCSQDFAVNDLLEQIAKEAKSSYDPGDIWISICNLTNSQKRRFIREASQII